MRASQINGCAVCLDMHTKEAAAAGESAVRINLVAAWREATVFTDAEHFDDDQLAAREPDQLAPLAHDRAQARVECLGFRLLVASAVPGTTRDRRRM